MYFLSNRKIIMHAFHVLMPQYYRSTFWIMGLLPRITQTRLLLIMVVVLCGVCLGACLCVYVCCSTKYYNTVWLYHMIYSYFCILTLAFLLPMNIKWCDNKCSSCLILQTDASSQSSVKLTNIKFWEFHDEYWQQQPNKHIIWRVLISFVIVKNDKKMCLWDWRFQ